MPANYIAQDDNGDMWILPLVPIGPEVWDHKIPYRGNYALDPVPEDIRIALETSLGRPVSPVPDYITRFYEPLLKLSDIRIALETSLGRPVSRSLADDYTHRRTFPAPAVASPVRLWRAEDIKRWVESLGPR